MAPGMRDDIYLHRPVAYSVVGNMHIPRKEVNMHMHMGKKRGKRHMMWVLWGALILLCTQAYMINWIRNLSMENNILIQENGKLHDAGVMLDKELTAVEDAYAELENHLDTTVSEINKTLGLLVTFKDAGLEVGDIRELVTLSKKVPYGSPFRHGHRYTSFYGPRDERFVGGNANGFHRGIDIVPVKWNDTVINATANGKIVDFGYSETLGKYIVFETEGGFRLKYGHLQTIFWQDSDTKAVKDVPVQVGDRLGIMGTTGTWSTAPHLHLEMYVYDSVADGWVELNPWRIIEYIGGEEYDRTQEVSEDTASLP
jgi:murein DD-endopeptidase MepM/ murein hydrolase activator NlpD